MSADKRRLPVGLPVPAVPKLLKHSQSEAPQLLPEIREIKAMKALRSSLEPNATT